MAGVVSFRIASPPFKGRNYGYPNARPNHSSSYCKCEPSAVLSILSGAIGGAALLVLDTREVERLSTQSIGHKFQVD